MMNKDKIMVFIPMYNCEGQISRVILQIADEYQKLFDEIVVIDNRSKDDSLIKAQNTIERKIKYCKATILQNNENYSLGGSIKIAFNYAIKNNFDYIITLHGDDQGDLKDAIPLINSREYKKYDMCIGARFHKDSKLKGYSWFRTLGNKAFNILCSMITLQKIQDLIAGLNIYKVGFIKASYPSYLSFPNNLTFDVHWLLYMIMKKGKFEYFPINWKEEDQVSNARVFRQAFIILGLFLRFVLNKETLFAQLEKGSEAGVDYGFEVIYTQDKAEINK